MRIDRGEVVEAVRRHLGLRVCVGIEAEEVVEVVFAELRRQRGCAIAAGLRDARLRGGGRVGRKGLSAERRAALLKDWADGFTYEELGRRHALSATAVGRYVRGEV